MKAVLVLIVGTLMVDSLLCATIKRTRLDEERVIDEQVKEEVVAELKKQEIEGVIIEEPIVPIEKEILPEVPVIAPLTARNVEEPIIAQNVPVQEKLVEIEEKSMDVKEPEFVDAMKLVSTEDKVEGVSNVVANVMEALKKQDVAVEAAPIMEEKLEIVAPLIKSETEAELPQVQEMINEDPKKENPKEEEIKNEIEMMKEEMPREKKDAVLLSEDNIKETINEMQKEPEMAKEENKEIEKPKELEMPKEEMMTEETKKESEIQMEAIKKPETEEPMKEPLMTLAESPKQAKSEEPHKAESELEMPKAEESKSEEPKPSELMLQEPKIEEPKLEKPKSDELKLEELTAEEPKIEQLKPDEAKLEEIMMTAESEKPQDEMIKRIDTEAERLEYVDAKEAAKEAVVQKENFPKEIAAQEKMDIVEESEPIEASRSEPIMEELKKEEELKPVEMVEFKLVEPMVVEQKIAEAKKVEEPAKVIEPLKVEAVEVKEQEVSESVKAVNVDEPLITEEKILPAGLPGVRNLEEKPQLINKEDIQTNLEQNSAPKEEIKEEIQTEKEMTPMQPELKQSPTTQSPGIIQSVLQPVLQTFGLAPAPAAAVVPAAASDPAEATVAEEGLAPTPTTARPNIIQQGIQTFQQGIQNIIGGTTQNSVAAAVESAEPTTSRPTIIQTLTNAVNATFNRPADSPQGPIATFLSNLSGSPSPTAASVDPSADEV